MSENSAHGSDFSINNNLPKSVPMDCGYVRHMNMRDMKRAAHGEASVDHSGGFIFTRDT